MAISSINPIQSIKSIEQLQNLFKNDDKTSVEGLSFSDILNNMIKDVNTTDETVKTDAVSLALGLTDDNLHTLEINATKAELALRTVVSVRNKALDAYSEIMRITI